MTTAQALAAWIAFCLVLAGGVGLWAWKRQQRRNDAGDTVPAEDFGISPRGGGGLPAEPPPKK